MGRGLVVLGRIFVCSLVGLGFGLMGRFWWAIVLRCALLAG